MLRQCVTFEVAMSKTQILPGGGRQQAGWRHFSYSPSILVIDGSRLKWGYLEAEDGVCQKLRFVDGSVEDRVDASACPFDAHTIAHTVPSASPACVHLRAWTAGIGLGHWVSRHRPKC